MEAKHTQGEWKIKGESYGNYISVGTDQQQVCKVNWGKEDTEYDFANAKLIASTPEMLAALNKAFVLLQKSYNTGEKPNYIDLREIENTIKKATN